MPPKNKKLSGISELALKEDPDIQAIFRLFERYEAEIELALKNNLDTLEKEESWGFLHAMHLRAKEQMMACIILYSHGYYAPTEALCRTVIEATINLYYCSLGDTCSMILSYFKSHLETERKQNKNWAESIENSAYPEETKEEHRQRIKNKYDALNLYEQLITKAFSQINRDYASANNTWPSIFDRFKAIGKEVDYRTVYAALCSQAHNDAEDLLNDFVHSVTENERGYNAQAFENQNFALYMVLMALTFLIEGTAIYIAKYNLNVTEKFLNIMTDAQNETTRVMQRTPLFED